MSAETASHRWWRDPRALAELFLASNLGFLGVDIGLAHAMNAFANPAEWIPVVFSVVATGVLAASWLVDGGLSPSMAGGPRHAAARGLGWLVGLGSIAVGTAGLVFHLESQFFRDRTIESLVYAAPFAAPLAYTGLGLLAILNRRMTAETGEWGSWVLMLALGGFLGNFVLCLADHAQNGFFHASEWTGVVAGAVGASVLAAVLAVPWDRGLRRLAGAMLVAQVAVGLAGFALHTSANLGRTMPTWWENVLYGAPAFAPLLFADLAALAALGLLAGVATGGESGRASTLDELGERTSTGA